MVLKAVPSPQDHNASPELEGGSNPEPSCQQENDGPLNLDEEKPCDKRISRTANSAVQHPIDRFGILDTNVENVSYMYHVLDLPDCEFSLSYTLRSL